MVDIREPSARPVYGISILAERTTYHDSVFQMERRRCESIPHARHRAGGAFNGRGSNKRYLGNNRAAQDRGHQGEMDMENARVSCQKATSGGGRREKGAKRIQAFGWCT